jgi:polysaccharide biosynthesis protein PslG
MRRVVLVLAAGALLLAPVAHADLPRSFVGIYDEDTSGLADQARLGVGIVRQPLDMARVEDEGWAPYDDYVTRAANAGVSVLPILIRRPELGPPASNAAFADFAGAAVARYGPTGSFWLEHSDVPFLPVHAWQVWNEPNIPNWWRRGGPNARRYVAMLRAGARAIRAADPGAEVVAAGLPNSKLGVPFLKYLDQMYRAGARGLFDTLAIHPYARDVGGMLALAERARAVMNRWHDRSRLWITEFGWSTGGDASAFRVSQRGQADRIAGSLSALIAERRALRLRGFIFFRWRDAVAPAGLGRDPWPLHTGLLDRDGSPKRGFWAFARVVRALRSPSGDGGPTASAELAQIARRDVRISPLGFAHVAIGCDSDQPGACGGVLRLRSAQPVSCGAGRIAAGAPLGSASFAIAAAPAVAPVRIAGSARRIADCARRIRVRASVASADRAHAAVARSVEFVLRAR